MSWKTFSLPKKYPTPSPEIVRNENKSRSFKRGDETRVMLMNMVKEGKLTVDDAMKKAYGMGVASVPYEEMADGDRTSNAKDGIGDVFNFGVYKYLKSNKVLKCVLQVDCQERLVAVLHRGEKQKIFSFNSIRGVEGSEESTRFFVKVDDATELELDADSFEEKNAIMRLLSVVICEAQQGFAIDKKGLFMRNKNVIKEGVVEKRGHSAAFLVWAKRFLRIVPGEITYFKIGEEENEGNALSFISLAPNSTLIRKIDVNGFLLITNKKEYGFRVPGADGADAEKERDDWILAIQEASRQSLYGIASQPQSQVQSPEAVANQQEAYLKHVIRTLQEELEQLGVILNIIDAPIRASAQVKKVREIVQSLKEQVHTGVLSWLLRSSAQSKGTPVGHSSSPASPSRNSPSSSSSLCRSPRIDDGMPPLNEGTRWDHVRSRDGVFSPKAKIGTGDAGRDLGCYINAASGHHSSEALQVVSRSRAELFQLAELSSSEHYNNLILDSAVPNEVALSSSLKVSHVDFAAECHPPGRKSSGDAIEPENEMPPPLPPKHGESRFPSKPSPDEDDMDVTREVHGEVHLGTDQLQLRADNYMVASRETSVRTESILGDVLARESASVQTLSSGAFPPPVLLPPPPPPPPNFLGSGVPPPPAQLQITFSKLPVKNGAKPTKKMKPLFWSKIPDSLVHDSIWISAKDRSEAFSLKALEDTFGAAADEAPLSKHAEVITQPSRKTLLDPKKAQNLGIFMSGFKLSAEEVDRKLSILDEQDGLELDHVMALKRFQPTAEEVEMYKSFNGDRKQLLPVDLFMIKLSEIPNLNCRLDILLTVLELPSQYSQVSRATNELLNACQSLHANKDFPRLLEYILSVGNFINGGTSRGCAYGFKLSALCKLVDIRSADKKHTLLQYIVNELADKDRDAVHCFEHMKEFLEPMEASFKGLVGEAEIMRRDLAKLSKALELYRDESNTMLRAFLKSLVEFIRGYEQKLGDLDRRCQVLTELSMSLKRQYGESVTSDFQEWLGHIAVFMKQLQRAVESSEEQVRRRSRGKRTLPYTCEDETEASLPINNDKHVVLTTENTPSVYLKELPISRSNFVHNISNDRTAICTSGDDTKLPMQYGKVCSYETKQAALIELRSACVTDNETRNVPFGSLVDDALCDSDDDDEISFPTKRGYLEKLSGGTRRRAKWDKRFFELTSAGYLNYYKKEDGKLCGSVYLRRLPLQFDAADNCVLLIRQDTRVFRLRAANEFEALDWYNVLTCYVHREELAI